MACDIHPTALVDPNAELGNDVVIGPYSIIEDDVIIGDRTRIGSQVVIGRHTRIGQENTIFHGAAVGLIPQDLKFAGEKTTLRIGDRNIIREFCTINRGTKARGETLIGNDCAILAYCHIAHDCSIGDHLIVSNNLAMAGHVQVGNHVTIGGVCSFHQFTRIGDHAMIQATCYVSQDVVPFALVGAGPVRIVDVNKIGLERRGFSQQRMLAVRRAYRTLFREHLNLEDALIKLSSEHADNGDIAQIITFARNSTRGILRMKQQGTTDD
ncbi:MAG: acyl-ACP--UDP-N-acetylglucosamine O-acyltransferase [Chitinispirillaceae bacterium]|nr:acyl-ACP--UDP-N-acetylglucosamine O-acyltransferase [Chitinispirillaceae bacterium]